MTVTNKSDHDEQLKKIIDALADSVIELPAEEIIAETLESGDNPQELAERTRAVLLMVVLNQRLADLGHWVNEKYWHYDKQGYHNNCLTCGMSVSFTGASNEVCGDALRGRCHSQQYTVFHRRRVSGG